jgi:hypothetical protein
MRSWLSPASLMWLCGHIFLVLVGMLIMTTEGQKLLGVAVGLSLGSSLLATGIAGLVLYLYVRSTDTLQDKLKILSDTGITSVFQHRSIRIKEEYDHRLRNATRIDLIGYGLSAFREDYAQEFEAWSGRADVRVLVIDPDFPAKQCSLADIRDVEENRPTGEIRREVERFEAELAGLASLDRTRFQCRRMRTIPAINLLRIDDEIFWGSYLMAEQSRNTPTLLVRRGGFLFDVLARHFEATWNSSAPPTARLGDHD